jgi:hypothetical protein
MLECQAGRLGRHFKGRLEQFNFVCSHGTACREPMDSSAGIRTRRTGCRRASST